MSYTFSGNLINWKILFSQKRDSLPDNPSFCKNVDDNPNLSKVNDFKGLLFLLFFQDHDDNHVRKVISKCDACLLVYNVCDRYSFEYACSVARKIRQPTKSNNTWSTPILFAGNKTDLEHFRWEKFSSLSIHFLTWLGMRFFFLISYTKCHLGSKKWSIKSLTF